jgi:hypothetical protein
MAFSFSPDLDDAVSRVRLAVGDITAPGIFQDAIYVALLTAAENDEAAATRAAAAALAAWAAKEPDRISEAGTTFSWAGRIAQWTKIALGQAGSAAPVVESASTASAPPTSAAVSTQAAW